MVANEFSGDDRIGIKRWLENFEELAEIYVWTNNMKLAYTRPLLTGSAQLFIAYKRSAKTWSGLKAALEDGFGTKVDTFRIHKELNERKKNMMKYIRNVCIRWLR